jgi:endogenous inhibitor of DNA gyrase (YacG/DUF329 family)
MASITKSPTKHPFRRFQLEDRMGVLLIKCPQTGKPVPTGIEVDPKSFANLPDVLSYLKCPECGLDHAWWTREAWLEDQVEAPPPKDEAA